MRTKFKVLRCGTWLALLVSAGCGREPPPEQESTPSPYTTEWLETSAPAEESGDLGEHRYSLAAAMRSGAVEASIRGTGYSSGLATTLTIRRTTEEPIEVVITPGLVLRSGVSGEQDMVLAGFAAVAGSDSDELLETISLPDLETHEFELETYCLDFDLDNPQAANVMALAAVSEAVAYIAREAHQSGYTSSTIQAAVWMAKDDKSIEEIREKFTLQDQDVADAFELLGTHGDEIFDRLRHDREGGVFSE